MIRIFTLLLLAMASATAAIAQEIITNGSFEAPPAIDIPPPWDEFGSPNRQPATLFEAAQDGSSYMSFHANQNGYIEGLRQGVAMDSGQHYSGAVYMFSDTIYNPGLGRLIIHAQLPPPSTADTLWWSDTIRSLNVWQMFTFDFVARADYATISIQSQNATGIASTIAIDSIGIHVDPISAVDPRRDQAHTWSYYDMMGRPWSGGRGLRVKVRDDGVRRLQFVR